MSIVTTIRHACWAASALLLLAGPARGQSPLDSLPAPPAPAPSATAVLAEHPVDLVIMGMRGHSALHDFILGSTAEHLMRSVELPVLLVP